MRSLFDIPAVLIERCGADDLQFSTRQRGLEDVSCVDGPLSAAGANDGVEFVDKENDLALGLLHLFYDSFETLLELPAKLGPRKQCGHVQRNDALLVHLLRHISTRDALCQTFDNGSLAHTWFAHEHRVVLGAPP